MNGSSLRKDLWDTDRLNLVRTLAILRGEKTLQFRSRCRLGFEATYATWDLLANIVTVRHRKSSITLEQLAWRLSEKEKVSVRYFDGTLMNL